jgi:hypothetical protein
MINEIKLLFDGIGHFRQLLKEGVGDATIVDAINDAKYLYIYYAGDKTTLKGYRTIRPFVLGTSTAGNKVLRAWQENGSSDSYAGLTGRKREDHEYHFDNKGKMKPGWRLFNVKYITSALPTGKKFSTEESKLPPLYNPNDKQIPSIIASIKVGGSNVQSKGLDTITEPDVISQKVDTSFFDRQGNKFQQFFKAGKKTKEVTADEIEHLYGVNAQMRRKSPRNLIVVANEKGDFVLKDIADTPKLPEDSIVGNLYDLYQKLVVSKQNVHDNSFFTSKENEIIKKQDELNKKNRSLFK